MIRILHILSVELNMGEGIQAVIMDYYRNMENSQIQFDFLVPDNRMRNEAQAYEDEATALGSRIFRYSKEKRTVFKLKQVMLLMRFIINHPEYKVVHIHHDKPGKIFLDVLALTLCGVPVRIVHSHMDLSHRKNWYKQKKYQLLLRMFTTHMFTCSIGAGVSMFGSKAVKSAKFRVVPNARDLDLYKYNPDVRFETRQKLEINDKYVILNIGGLRTQKNQLFLLEMFACTLDQMHKHNIRSNAVLLIAGDGILRDVLKQKADEMELKDCVKFLGLRSDVAQLLQAADIFLLPSLNEGLPGAVIEAQAAGLPCLVSDTVTSECKVTDNVEFLPIDNGPEIWAERILAYRDFERGDTTEEVRRAGYDIKDAAKRLEEFYLNAY